MLESDGNIVKESEEGESRRRRALTRKRQRTRKREQPQALLLWPIRALGKNSEAQCAVTPPLP